MSWRPACLVVTALLIVEGMAAAGAKPLDLPVNPTISCRVQVMATATCGLLVGVGINADAGLEGVIVLEEPQKPAEPVVYETIDTVCPCFCDLLRKYWQSLVQCPGGSATLANTPEDLRRMETEWERIWFADQPSHLIPERFDGKPQKPSPHALVPDKNFLRPALPPIDPKVVEALEKLLGETGDPDMPKLLIRGAEPASEEEQEANLHSGWLPAPIEPGFPSLLRLPIRVNLAVDDEEATEDEPEILGMPFELFVPDWNALVREMLDALSMGSCVEIDGSNLGHLRLLAEKQLGAVQIQVFSDNEGLWRCVVTTLDPEASGDLRAAQRAQNDRLLHWIVSLNDGLDPVEDWDLITCEGVTWEDLLVPDYDG